MRPSSKQLATILTRSFDLGYTADLFYDEVRLFEGLPITEPSFKWNSEAEVEATGQVTVTWTDDHGGSLRPEEPQDWLAPFGSRLVVYAVITVGTVSERIRLGDYDITSVPRVNSSLYVFGETTITIGDVVELELTDRMVEVQRDRFTRLEQPTVGGSVWSEVARLAGLQVTRTVPDRTINAAVIYSESKTEAIQDLLGILDAVPFMDYDGTLAARPKAPPAPSGQLNTGPDGVVTKIGASLDADGVYNGVVIRAETDGQKQVLAEKWVPSGPLRATVPGGLRTPFHRKPRFYSSPQITTEAQALAAIDSLLATYSQPRASELQIQCIADPTLQVGDVRTVTDGPVRWTLRVTTMDLGSAPTMTVNGDVLNREVLID
jgi:hypothetical protein